MEIGIADSDAPTVTERWWDGLGVRRARVVVPWDVATTTGAAGTRRRERFEAYVVNAAAKAVELLVVFAPSADLRDPLGRPLAPAAADYAAGLAALLRRWPQVRAICPWNEPNNRDARRYPLARAPELAAEYWLRRRALCPADTTVLAGGFAGIPGDDGYVRAYQRHLHRSGANPEAWAFHAHGDANARQERGSTRAAVARWYLSALGGRRRRDARIWIDEAGARWRDARGVVWGDDAQLRATELLLGLGALDERIESLYYYNYSNQCAQPSRCAVQDRGLVSPSPLNGEPPGYDEADRRRPAYFAVAEAAGG